MKFALIQMNPTVGAVKENAAKFLKLAQEAAADTDRDTNDGDTEQVDPLETRGIHGSLQAADSDRHQIDGERGMKGFCDHQSILPGARCSRRRIAPPV